MQPQSGSRAHTFVVIFPPPQSQARNGSEKQVLMLGQYAHRLEMAVKSKF